MADDKKLYIMRGLPGSGKSTFLSRTAPSARICSADHYFIGPDGKYVFNAAKLKQAHDTCFYNFHIAINTEPVVAVDNTNLTWWEASRYILLGLKAGYQVELVDIRVSVETAAARNIHSVPAEHIQKMASRKLEIPKEVMENSAFKYTVIEQ